MKAIALTPGTTTLRIVDRPEPGITAADEIKLRMVRVGICGTDREEAAGGRALAPSGQKDLVIGHEMFGQVVEIGKGVTRVKPGDFAVLTVRRGCGECLPCEMNRSDMCLTGRYQERGIWGRDGYQTQFVVDKQQYAVRVPAELERIGVLTEPLSVVEKAIDEVVRVQVARLPDAPATPAWLFGRRCLVAGLGPVGLLGAMVLRLRGAEVFGLDVVDLDTARPKWLKFIGGQYLDGRKISPGKAQEVTGCIDLILEATGVAPLQFNLLDALGQDGAYVLTGIPGGERPIEIPGAELLRCLVLNNQLMLGSVNAARDHFQMGVNDLAQAQALWGEQLAKLITSRHPYTEFQASLHHHSPDEIKTVIEWCDVP